MVGSASLLRSGKLTTDELRKGLDTIERNARNTGSDHRRSSGYQPHNSGKVRLDVRRIDLPNVLNQSIDTVHATADAKRIHLDSVIDLDAGTILGDPDRLQQVFWNLLNDAEQVYSQRREVRVVVKSYNYEH